MSDTFLPKDWVVSKLENIVFILDSLRKPVNNKERETRINGVDIQHLYPYYGATGEVGKIDDYLFDEELIALGEDGAPFLDRNKNKAYMLYGKTWVNNHAHVLKSINGISISKYIYYFLNQFDYHEYVNGGTRLKLTQASMRNIPVIIPPISEQKIIAEKLDLLLAQVKETKSRLERIPEILKQFRQSVLSNAVRGRLTEGCASNTLPNKILLGNVLELAYGKSLPAKSRSGNGYPVYGSNGEIGKHKQKLVSGPFIIVGRKGSYGEITWSDDSGWPIDTTYYVVLKIKSDLKFIFYLLQTLGLNQLNRSTAIPGLNREDAYNLEINLPPPEEQHEIVRRVEQLFAYADKIEQQVNAALEKVNNLTQSILAKAFRGELTAQWRAENVDLITGENSATALLEKIQAEREQNNKSKKKK